MLVGYSAKIFFSCDFSSLGSSVGQWVCGSVGLCLTSISNSHFQNNFNSTFSIIVKCNDAYINLAMIGAL